MVPVTSVGPVADRIRASDDGLGLGAGAASPGS